MLGSWLKLHNTFEEEPGEDLTHIGVLILSGNVKWLISFAAATNEKLPLNSINIATTLAREKLAVADFLFGMEVLGGIVSNETLFTLASDCVLAGNLLGLKALEEHGFKVTAAQQHTAISQKLLIVTGVGSQTPNYLEQQYGYLSEWVKLISGGRGWRNEEEREYAYSVLREAEQKRNKSTK